MNKFNRYLIITFLLLIYWSFLIPGPRVATDFHYSYPEHLKSLFDLPYVWSTRWGGGLGHYVSTLWAWPFELLYGFAGILGISFQLIERIFGILLTVLLGFISINKLLTYYKLSSLGRLTGVAFFLANSYLILLIDGGQLNLAIAYCILPLSFYFYRNFIDKFKLNHLLLFTLSIAGISAVDLRVVILLAFLILLNLIFDLAFLRRIKSSWDLLKKNILIGLFSLTFLILFNLYWILPIIFSETNSFIPVNFSNFDQINLASFSNISNGIFFQQPHWFKNNFGEISNIRVDFLLIPLLILLAPLLIRKDKRIVFWMFVILVSLFFSKGGQKPFPQLNLWLYENIPMFILFKDPTKFFFLLAIGYSILLGLSVEKIYQILAKKIKRKYLGAVFSLFIVGYLVYLNNPVILLKMNGLFSAPIYEKEFRSLNQAISSNDKFGRVVWIPVKSPLGFESPDHPAVDAFSLLEKRPFAVGVKGTYERLNFFREATHSGQLLDVSGVQSIAYPYLDYRKNISADQIKYYYTFLDQLLQTTYIKELDSNSQIPKLDLKQYQDRIFIVENLWWVIGADKIYEESVKPGLGLANNGIIFAEESVGLGERIKGIPFAKILFRNKTQLDFIASLLKEDDFIFLADNLKRDPDAFGWWKRETTDLIGWRNFLQEKYGIDNQDFDFGGGWAIAEKELVLKVDDVRFKQDSILLVRVLESSNGGEVSFYQDEEFIGSINTLKDTNNVRWFEVGKLKKDDQIFIKTKGDINVLNSLGVVNEQDWAALRIEGLEILRKQQVYSYEVIDDSMQQATIFYEKQNPTSYKLKVKGINKPQLIVLSESFNPLWQLNNQKALPVYSFLNGFVVEKDGEYLINFSAQKYVYPGLIIFLISLGTVLLLFLKVKNE